MASSSPSTDIDVSGLGSVEIGEVVPGRALPDEARERKRVLNVLAQRRYRKRKKYRQAALEDMLNKAVNTVSNVSNEPRPTTDENRNSESVSGGVSMGSSDCNQQSSDERDLGDLDSQPPSLWDYPNPPGPPDLWVTQFLDLSGDTLDSWPSSSPNSLSTLLQVDDVQNTTFSDDYHLAVPELDLLRASFENATRLKSAERLWDMQSGSVFQDLAIQSQWVDELPSNLQPTTTQLVVAHHPILDIIPWPSARDKLIRMYNMPSRFWPRHPKDGSECSLIRLVYDMEDGGIRIWGADPASEESWEIEESLFVAWWWALDPKILLATNQRRVGRGQPPLQEISVQKPQVISS